MSSIMYSPRFDSRMGRALIRIKETPAFKRVLDLTLTIPALVFLSPALGVIALLIKFHDRGPIFFRSVRIGKDGVPFRFLKFRTMVVNAEALKAQLLHRNQHGLSVTFKMKNDPRITPIGCILRRWSLDELPQLWNVLLGSMSLVGPRPAVPAEVARYTDFDRERLRVLPGITCIWQVSGRSDVPFERQVLMDREYIEKQSLWTDLILLGKTLPAVFIGRGAY